MTSLKSRLFRLSGLNSLYSKHLARSISQKKRRERERERHGERKREVKRRRWNPDIFISAAKTRMRTTQGLCGHCCCGLLCLGYTNKHTHTHRMIQLHVPCTWILRANSSLIVSKSRGNCSATSMNQINGKCFKIEKKKIIINIKRKYWTCPKWKEASLLLTQRLFMSIIARGRSQGLGWLVHILLLLFSLSAVSEWIQQSVLL